MKNIKYFTFLFSILFIFSIQFAQGQYVEKEEREKEEKAEKQNNKTSENPLSNLSFSERLIFGGNLALQFGNPTVIDISPMVGYMFTPSFNAGIGGTYFYYSFEDPRFKIQANLYGGRVYAQYIIKESFFLYTEQEFMSTEFFDETDAEFRREWLFNPLVGGGIRQSIGGRSAINLMVLYNLNHQPTKSIYPNPWIIRVGIML